MSDLARVVTRFGAELILRTADGALLRAVSRRNLAKGEPPHLRAPVCGDRVRYTAGDGAKAIATALEPRRNVLVRPDHRGRPTAGAANIDQVLIVIAAQPTPDWGMLDRYLTAIAALPAAPLLVLNKCDLPETASNPLLRATQSLYTGLGYPLLCVSALHGAGIDALRERLQGQTSLLVGQSGVGKSSLIRALDPALSVRVGELSAISGEGRHTTTVAHLYALASGGDLIDSPGVRDFAPYQPSADDLAAGFPEIAARARECRFHDCRHLAEPDCAVKDAVDAGRLAPTRLRSYHALARNCV
ncbi:ribosome small subunit-dependent GTPase A [Acidihalobacter ferrooxydans]|uniref:Small ribosomal subunit biogenesis GTPase RsgA n=1 Tax=Acidihalobacter ferrooxydans TaxID=1765967 RepID=A0A1P8UG87_9GAMM|nr:ribosome small subunit-dependent GTPase A [Acidihalobacter ferrooxydans]APZ42868.1 ribosome small subunit-dependent GTPase A [Acidihalobacter ferrooxydans]